MRKGSTFSEMPTARSWRQSIGSTSIWRRSPKSGGGEAWSVPGCWISSRWRSTKTRSFPSIKGTFRTQVRAGGRSWRRWKKRCRRTSSRPLCTPDSGLVRSIPLRKRFSRRCERNLAAISNARAVGSPRSKALVFSPRPRTVRSHEPEPAALLAGAARRSLHLGDFWSRWRFDEAQADSGAVQLAILRPDAEGLRNRRSGEKASDRRLLSGGDGEGPSPVRHVAGGAGHLVGFRAPPLLHLRGFQRSPDVSEAGRSACRGGEETRHRRQPASLPGNPSGCFRTDRSKPWQGRTGQATGWPLDASGGGEALWTGPGIGDRAQQVSARGVSRESNLSNRPLPRERDCSKHSRLPLCQWDLRTGLESPLRRPRSDHGGRGAGDGGTRRLLRQDRRDARHDSKSHVPAAHAGGDGTADLFPGRGGSQREGEGSRCNPAFSARGYSAERRSRPVRRGHHSQQPGPGLPERAQRREGFQDRDVRGTEALRR